MTRPPIRALPRFHRLAGPLLLSIGSGCALRGPFAPEPEGSAESPHAVRGPGGDVLVTWGSVHADGRADILIAREDRNPVRVNPVPHTAVAGRQVGPRIAITPAGRVLVSWVDRWRDPAGDILIAASDDGGRTFGSPRRVNDDAGFAGQEYQDIAALPDATIALAWLDERGAPPDDENRKQVYFAFSSDGGRTFTPNVPLTASPRGVCPCCRPGICASPDGSLHVIYRDRAGDELLLRVRTRRARDREFGEPVTVSGASWRFPACPVDGPSLLAGIDGELCAAWMDGSSGREALWTAVSSDAGRSFHRARPLDETSSGSSGHVHLARAKVSAMAVWDDDSGRIWLRALEERSASAMLVAGSEDRAARSPQVAVEGDVVHVFWTETDWRESDAAAGPVPPSRLRHARLMVKGGALILAP